MKGCLVAGIVALAMWFAGCIGVDSAEPLVFTTASSMERSALVLESMGGVEVLFALIAVLDDGREACPRTVDSGGVRTISGGCSGADGTHWNGKLEVKNFIGARDASKPVTFTFSSFGPDELIVAGTLSVTASTITSKVTVSGEIPLIRVDAGWTSSGNATRAVADSTVELVGNGRADLSGEWDLERPFGALELQGEELFRLDFGRSDSDGCATATLDGASVGAYCPLTVSLFAPAGGAGDLAAQSSWQQVTGVANAQLMQVSPRRLTNLLSALAD